jgi:hypothetical protein
MSGTSKPKLPTVMMVNTKRGPVRIEDATREELIDIVKILTRELESLHVMHKEDMETAWNLSSPTQTAKPVHSSWHLLSLAIRLRWMLFIQSLAKALVGTK